MRGESANIPCAVAGARPNCGDTEDQIICAYKEQSTPTLQPRQVESQQPVHCVTSIMTAQLLRGRDSLPHVGLVM